MLVENADILKGPGTSPIIPTDNNDEFMFIEADDYNNPGDWVIVGAQIAGSGRGRDWDCHQPEHGDWPERR